MRSKTEAKKYSITQAASRLFLRYGFDNCSMDAVAREAGVSKQTVYGYYASKEALFIDVMTQYVDELWEKGADISLRAHTTQDLQDRLEDWGSDFVHHLMQPEYVALLRTVIAEAPRHPELTQAFQAHVPRRALQSVTGLLREARQQGLLRFGSPQAAAGLFVGGLILYVLTHGLLKQSEGTTIETAVNQTVAEFLQSHTIEHVVIKNGGY